MQISAAVPKKWKPRSITWSFASDRMSFAGIHGRSASQFTEKARQSWVKISLRVNLIKFIIFLLVERHQKEENLFFNDTKFPTRDPFRSVFSSLQTAIAMFTVAARTTFPADWKMGNLSGSSLSKSCWRGSKSLARQWFAKSERVMRSGRIRDKSQFSLHLKFED